MGGPALVGGELDRVHRPESQGRALALALAFLALGAVLYLLVPADGAYARYGAWPIRLNCALAASGVLLALAGLALALSYRHPGHNTNALLLGLAVLGRATARGFFRVRRIGTLWGLAVLAAALLTSS